MGDMGDRKSAPPPARTGVSKKGRRVTAEQLFRSRPKKSIAIFPGGGLLDAGSCGNPSGVNGGQTQRGVIAGWSSKSRGRMRKFLLTHRPPEGYQTWAVTLTVPGPILSRDEHKRLWNHYQVKLRRKGCCAVWRLEVQQRGQRHWHCIVSSPDIRHGAEDVVFSWFAALRALPRVDWETECCKYMQITRDQIPGAECYAVRKERVTDDAGWLRYTLDHATKAKQSQVAVGLGRHWGIIGRDLYTRMMPDRQYDLSVAQYAVLLRILRRMYTPTVLDCRAPFGRRLGYSCRRGSVGRSCWFGSAETQRRAIEYALRARPSDYDHYMSDGRVIGRPTSLPRE
jgi:hypothetical protein